MRTSWYGSFAGKSGSFAGRRRSAAAPCPGSFRPWLELLESRTLLSAGDLDPSFGVGGQVQTDFPPNTSASATAMVLQPDGKIVVAGGAENSATGASSFALARYNPDGSLDPGFGTAGRVTTSVQGAGNVGVALQTDGKIVLAGAGTPPSGTHTELVLFRYQPDGSLDSSFGTGGEVIVDFEGVGSVAIQPDGKILTTANGHAGTSTKTGGVLRFNPDGSLDQGFGGGVGSTPSTRAGDLALQADGRILVVTFNAPFAPPSVSRLNVDGSRDNAFGSFGQVSVDMAPSPLAVQPDGRIVVAGTDVTNNTVFRVGRINTNGTIDVTFGTGGYVNTDFGSGTNANATAVALQPDGRIIVAGSVTPTGSPNSSFALIRYTPNGGLDDSFGSGGKVTTAFAPPQSAASASAVAIQADGKIVAAGFTQDPTTATITGSFAVVRYLGDTPIADANQRFLTHVYLDLLGRLPDSGGLAFWTGLLNQGVSRTQVVQMIEGSSEYHTVEVEFLYGYVLGRAADPTGQSVWGNFLAAGGTAEQLEANLLGSDEYFSGRGGGNNQSFLQGVYRDVLGRVLDPSGNQTWSQALSAGASRTAVAAAILASLESDRDEVQALYHKILRRSADSSGLSFFTNALQQGVPNEAVLAALAGSDEYFARP